MKEVKGRTDKRTRDGKVTFRIWESDFPDFWKVTFRLVFQVKLSGNRLSGFLESDFPDFWKVTFRTWEIDFPESLNSV